MRPFYLRDMPLTLRLKAQGVSMDSESYLSRGLHTTGDAVLSRLPLMDLGTPTLVIRCGRTRLIAQFRHRLGETHAHIVFMSPAPRDGILDGALEDAWMHGLDALARVAGQRGAHTIHAEVDENGAVFELLRRAGYGAYARQDLWRRNPALPSLAPSIRLRQVMDRDIPGIHSLIDRTVPRLVQQADPDLPRDGLIYVRDGETRGYVAVIEGSRGIYLKPYLLPDAYDEGRAILDSALALLPRVAKVPVYCCVRSHQEWLRGPLAEQGFDPWARQTVMVKYTTARVQHAVFAPLVALNGLVISHSCGPGGSRS